MKRIQRKRTKGFKLPGNTVCVTRGTKWGNPFVVSEHKDSWAVYEDGNMLKVFSTKEKALTAAVDYYRTYVNRQIISGKLNIFDLVGKNLACFCPPEKPCHADYLLTLANKASKTFELEVK